jgi:tripartite-type tricarboxylate transporter receptor subunit TctC
MFGITLMRRAYKGLAIAVLASALPLHIAWAQWPDHPNRIIVPWPAGGSTDQVTRIAAAELEKALGQKIEVLNQPGASGSIGVQNVLDAPRDGYTWAAGAAKDLGAYRVLGLVNTNIRDWHLYLLVANVPVLSVNEK